MKNSTRYTATDAMFDVVIVLSKSGSARMTRGPTRLGRDERALSLTISVPRKIFTVPALSATLTIPDIDSQPVINVGDVEHALREALGVDIDIRINPPDMPE